MNFLHSELNVPDGHVVQVTLAGHEANVRLLDDANFESYRNGASFDTAEGGHCTASPVVLAPPQPGQWHLVIDLGGEAGEVRAAVAVRPARD